jgi:hypothetical protein
MANRRELLVGAAALASGVGAAGFASCGGGSKTQSSQTVSTVAMRNDAALVNGLLDLEDSAVVAYETIGGALGRRFGAQEREHATALRKAIVDLGAEPLRPKPAAEYRAAFPPLLDRRAALAFALDVETTAIGAYADAVPRIATRPLRVTLAAIMATESEHAAAVLGRLGRPRVPDAFVTGPPPEGSG